MVEEKKQILGEIVNIEQGKATYRYPSEEETLESDVELLGFDIGNEYWKDAIDSMIKLSRFNADKKIMIEVF